MLLMPFILYPPPPQVAKAAPSPKYNQEEIQKERKRNLKTVCEDLNRTHAINADPLSMLKQLDHVFVFPKINMMYCYVPKVGTTSWKRLFLAILGHPEFINGSAGTHSKADKVFLKLSQISRDKAKMPLSEYKSFFFVRNPYTRLLSIFRNKLEIPPDNYTYSLHEFQSRVKEWIRKYKPDLAKMYPSKRISFEEFVTYYTGLKVDARKNEHWEDMYKLCHPCTLSYDFIGTYETLETDKKFLIDQMQSEIRLPDEDLRTTHSSNDSVLMNYYSQLPDHLLEELSHSPGLTRDCKLFGYEMPECIRRNFTKTTNI